MVSPAELVGPTRRGRKVVISGDTSPSEAIVELARGADLLVHEATFGDDELERARETMHSTARRPPRSPQRAGVKRLVLNHLSARYTREAPDLLAQAKAVFPATQIARDGMVVGVPFGDGVADG